MDHTTPSASGRTVRRSKNGCWTCRAKKVKCDEVRPKCGRCVRLRLLCDYEPRARHNEIITMSQGYTMTLETSATMPAWARRAALTRALALPIQLPELPNSASSLNLTSADHEAIRYFRTTFARIHHTKNPDFSLFSILFKIAERDVMVMHVLLALGGQEIEFRRNSVADGVDFQPLEIEASTRGHTRWTPLQHYSAALGLLADSIGSADDGRQLDLDAICSALYLMLVYEQKYGDATCSGLSNHLAGAALIIKHRCQDLHHQITVLGRQGTPVLSSDYQSQDGSETTLVSLLVTRILVWIALCDSSASTFGLDGHFNSELKVIMGPEDVTPLNGFDILHRFSNSLYRTMWGAAYPQSELLDDVENRDIFALLCACMQLRYMVAELGKLDELELEKRLPTTRLAFQQFDLRYGELLEVATELSISTDNSHRLVANIRAFVPLYHAIKLQLHRITTRADVETDIEIIPEAHIKAIVDLAVQANRHQGIEALIRIAWPLFVVALETDNAIQRDWILQNFKEMGRYSRNLERANRFLVEAVQVQRCNGEKLDVVQHIMQTHGELFVI